MNHISTKFDLSFNLHDKRVKSRGNNNAFFIEGGGTKGIFAIGVLKYLYGDNPYCKLEDFNIFGGTSVGSYLSATLSLGYTSDDINDIVSKIDIGKLIDHGYMAIFSAYRLGTLGYLFDDTGRENIVKTILNYKMPQIIEHLGLNKDNEILTGEQLTFGDLRKLIENYPAIYRHLIVNSVDISRNQQIFITSLEEKWDNITLYDALLASSAIPFVFKPVTLYYDSCNDTYGYNQTDTTTINTLVDGGVSASNPIGFFLINNTYSDYNLWLLKFASHPNYIKINGISTLLNQLVNFLIGGNDTVENDLIKYIYKINTINLHSTAGILDMYTTEEIIDHINDIYNKCKNGDLRFND